MPKRTKQRNSKSTLRRHQSTTRFPTVTESKKGRFKTNLLRGGLLLLGSGGSLGRALALLGRGGGVTLARGLGLGRSPESLWVAMSITLHSENWVACTVHCTHQVVAEELHDKGRVLVALLAQGIEF